MKTLLLSYSLTGNNDALANSITKKLKAEHIKITELKKRTNGTIAADLLLQRTPITKPEAQVISSYDLVIFIGPIWLGQPAFPFKSYFKYLKKHAVKYAFISISGGAMNDNPGLFSVLKKKTGMEPIILVDNHIVDLLPSKEKATSQETSSYRLTEEDVYKLSWKTIGLLKEKLPQEVFLS